MRPRVTAAVEGRNASLVCQYYAGRDTFSRSDPGRDGSQNIYGPIITR